VQKLGCTGACGKMRYGDYGLKPMNGVNCQRHCGRRSRQRGVSATEFALVFPLLMALCYSTIVYGYVYMVQQSINFAAQTGAQAAVGLVPGATNQSSIIQSAAGNALAWLPASQQSRLTIVSGSNASYCNVPAAQQASVIIVQVSFAVGGSSTTASLFPTFSLPAVGNFPILPTNLYACAVAYP
jgi:Flp pilus assembly protein TadG